MGDHDIIDTIATDLAGMYEAGRVEFPARAAMVSKTAGTLADATERLNQESAFAGDPKALVDALAILDDVYNALSRTTKILDDSAVGLIHVADDFVATDARAREAARQIQHNLLDGNPPAAAPIPSPIGDTTQPGDGDNILPVPQPRTPDDDLSDRDHGLDDVKPPVPKG